MNSAITLTFRYEEPDYVRALRAHYAARLRWRLDLCAALVLAGFGVYLLRSPRMHWFGVCFLVASALVALLLLVAFVVIPPIAFRCEPKFRDDYSLTFSADGIHFRTAHIDSMLQWSLYTRALIDVHSVLLYHGSRDFTLIPRRVFQSVQQQQAFERLIAEEIPQIFRRDN